jgi:hypothetical protein
MDFDRWGQASLLSRRKPACGMGNIEGYRDSSIWPK